MPDEPTESPGRRWVDADAFLGLRAEVQDLRLRLADEVRTRRVVVTDDAGIGRIRMAVDGDACRIVMLDQDGFERITLTAQPDIGAVAVQSRAHNGPTRVDLFALDPDDGDDSAVVGVELIDGGNSVGGLTVYEGRQPTVWTEPLV